MSRKTKSILVSEMYHIPSITGSDPTTRRSYKPAPSTLHALYEHRAKMTGHWKYSANNTCEVLWPRGLASSLGNRSKPCGQTPDGTFSKISKKSQSILGLRNVSCTIYGSRSHNQEMAWVISFDPPHTFKAPCKDDWLQEMQRKQHLWVTVTPVSCIPIGKFKTEEYV